MLRMKNNIFMEETRITGMKPPNFSPLCKNEEQLTFALHCSAKFFAARRSNIYYQSWNQYDRISGLQRTLNLNVDSQQNLFGYANDPPNASTDSLSKFSEFCWNLLKIY